jgi:hypothetical protein
MSEEKNSNPTKGFFDFFKQLFGCLKQGASAAEHVKDFSAAQPEEPQPPAQPVRDAVFAPPR